MVKHILGIIKIIQYEDWSIIKENDGAFCIPYLIEKNQIDAIIGLPANIFFGTGIPTIIMVLRQNRENDDVLIVDASKGYVKEGKNNKLRACDIKKIVDTIKNRKTVPKYAMQHWLRKKQ